MDGNHQLGWSVRCVRNLGMDSDVEMGDDTRNVPQDYIEYYRQART